ncbi:polyadenylate-binding protein-interacting protein 1-like [Linepithema humile]|uniref:polyadenylate-binding protein-interacting protein 1-like n=1 Tax=Linepithema humile TaxID=83485 RepID=UPI00351F400B
MEFSKGDRKEASGDDRRQSGYRNWRVSQDPPVELRRPHSASTNQPKPEHSLDEKKSSLSPQAAEFVPRSLQLRIPPPAAYEREIPRQIAKSSVQNRINIARFNKSTPNAYIPPYAMGNDALRDALQQQCNVQDSVTGSYNRYTDGQNNLNDCKKEEKQNEEKEIYHILIQELFNIINILIVNPAQFSHLIPQFVNKIRRDGNMRHIEMILKTIIEWSIDESNFRYNGARFCEYFDSTAEVRTKELFRDVLFMLCKLQTRLQEQEWHNVCEKDRDQKKCNGLILFLAELVAQMDESYAFTLGELLVWFITKVLQRPASNTVKYICQALKLAGHVLEKDKSKSGDMENMMRALTELVNNGQVDTHVGNMVNNVHEMRKNWEKSASNCDSPSTNNAVLNQVQQPDQPGASNYNSSELNTAPLVEVQQPLDLPVMYGPDGEVLSAEESKFLQDHMMLDLDDIETSDEGSIDDNFDDEIATAYEEFLKEEPK